MIHNFVIGSKVVLLIGLRTAFLVSQAIAEASLPALVLVVGAIAILVKRRSA